MKVSENGHVERRCCGLIFSCFSLLGTGVVDCAVLFEGFFRIYWATGTRHFHYSYRLTSNFTTTLDTVNRVIHDWYTG